MEFLNSRSTLDNRVMGELSMYTCRLSRGNRLSRGIERQFCGSVVKCI